MNKKKISIMILGFKYKKRTTMFILDEEETHLKKNLPFASKEDIFCRFSLSPAGQ